MRSLKPPVLILTLALLLVGLTVQADLEDSQWRQLKNAWNQAFLGGDGALRLEVVKKLAEADDVRPLPLLAHTVKIANTAIQKLTKKEPEIRKAMDKIPFTKKADGTRTFSSEDLARWKELGAQLKQLQAAVTANLEVKRVALSGFTNKSDKKALDWLFKKGVRHPDWEIRVGVIEAMAEIDDTRSVPSLVEALKDRDPHVRVAAIDAVEIKEAKSAKDDLLALLQDKAWEVVVAVLKVIESFEYRDVATMDALIEGISTAEGRLGEEYERVLEILTGISYYGDGKLWKRWWSQNREKYVKAQGGEKPGEKKGPGEASGGDGGKSGGSPAPMPPRPPKKKPHVTASFYGIETKSHNIIYILDVSGSMAGPASRKARKGGKKGPTITGSGHRKKPGEPRDDGPKGDTKLDFAKYELKKSIRMLPTKAWFNVIFYNDKFEVWREDMVRATHVNKRKAYEFVDAQEPASSTNIFDAMEKAFKIAGPGKPKRKHDERYAKSFGGADTIFLLSDGSPNAGRIPKAEDILVEVRALNKLRKITIHTVGVGAHNVPFMKALAEQNGGKYCKAD